MKTWRKGIAAAVLLAAAAAAYAKVLEPWREDRQWVFAARSGLQALARLEQAYCFQSGRYTSDVLTLSSMTQDPQTITRMRDTAFYPGSLRLQVFRDSVMLSAQALDRRHTPIAFQASRPAP